MLLLASGCAGQSPPANGGDIQVPAQPESDTSVKDAPPAQLADACAWEDSCIEHGDCAERCDAGDLHACYGQASMTSDQELGSETLTQALLRCPSGDAVACWAVEAFHTVGFGEDLQISDLRRMAKHGCAANCSESCIALAGYECQLRLAPGAHYDPKLSRKYLKQACDLGSKEACDALAGKGVIHGCEE